MAHRAHRMWVRTLTAASVTVLASASFLLQPSPVAANAVSSAPGVYFSIGQPTQLMRADVQPGGGLDFSAVGVPDAGGYNALAAHLPTQTLYAVGASSQSLVTVDAAGTVHDEFFLGETSSVAAFAEGAMQDRFYYIPRNTNQLSWVNVLTHDRGTTAMSASYAPVDFVFSDDAFWGVTIENGVALLVRVMLDGQVSSAALTDVDVSVFSSGSFGGAWKYGNGNLGFSNNSGGILQIRIADSVEMTAETVGYTTSPPSSSVDAAAIPYEPTDLGVQLVAERSGPALPLTLSVTVRNNGQNPSSGYVIDLASLDLDSRAIDPGDGCVVSGGGVKCTGDALPPGEERRHSFAVTYQPGDADISWSWQASVLGYEADPVPPNDQAVIADSVGGEIGIRIRLQDTNRNLAADPGERYEAFGVLRNDSSMTVYSVVVNASGLIKDSLRVESPMRPGEQRTVRFAGVMPPATATGPSHVVMEFRGEIDGVPLLLGEDSLQLVGVSGTGDGGTGDGGTGGGGTGGANGPGAAGGADPAGGQLGWGGSGGRGGSADSSGVAPGSSGLSATGDFWAPGVAAATVALVASGLLLLLLPRARRSSLDIAGAPRRRAR